MTDMPPAAVEETAPPGPDPRWAQLAAPFPPDEIEKLPKQLKKNDEDRYQCRADTKASADGYYCGGYHARSIHLDYVGHAGVTQRLNAADPTWTWEPMYRDVPHDVLLAAIGTGNEAIVRQVIENAPMLFTQGGLWIRMTVLGVTRPGFGDAKGKAGPDAVKEIIGDAIRNAAMRFGVATYLWSKSDKARAGGVDVDEDAPAAQSRQVRPRQQARTGPAAHGDDDGHAADALASGLVSSTAGVHPPTGGKVTPLRRGPAEEQTAGETAAQRAIRQRREADQARHRPDPAKSRNDRDPAAWPQRPADDGEAAALVEEILACTDMKRFTALWNMGKQLARAGLDTDVRRMLSDDAAALLTLDRSQPVPLGAVVQRSAKHFERAAVSVRMALDPAPVPTP